MVADLPAAGTAPSTGVASALRRHWFVAVVPLIVFVGVAVMLGLNRPPRYTATAHLSVGRIFVNNPAGVSGVIEATRSLAAVYSRAIGSSAVRNDIARRLRGRARTGSESVTATPIPDSPLIKVSAESSSPRAALALALAASAALADYVKRQESRNDDTRILAQYKRVVRRHRNQLDAWRLAQRRDEREPTDENQAARRRAFAAAETSRLRRDALRLSYETAVQGTTSSPALDLFSRPRAASSDRSEMMQILVFLGVIAGLAAGTALALLRTYHETRPRRP